MKAGDEIVFNPEKMILSINGKNREFDIIKKNEGDLELWDITIKNETRKRNNT